MRGHKAVPKTKPRATKHASTNCCAIVRNSSATAIATNATASAVDTGAIASDSTIATNAFVVKVHGNDLANEHAPHAGVISGGSSVAGERRFSLSFCDASIVFGDQSDRSTDRSSGHAM